MGSVFPALLPHFPSLHLPLEKQEEYQKYMNQLMGQWEAEFNRVNAEQQKESAKEYGEEMGKILIPLSQRKMITVMEL